MTRPIRYLNLPAIALIFLAACRPAPPPAANVVGQASGQPRAAAPLSRPTAVGEVYIASRGHDPFHRPQCKWALKINPAYMERFSSRAAAVESGHRPCKVCRP